MSRSRRYGMALVPAVLLIIAACEAAPPTSPAPASPTADATAAPITPTPTAGSTAPAASPEVTPTASSTSEPNQSAPPSEFVTAWQDVTGQTINRTAEWTNKVELADIDGDGNVDVLFANGGDYETPGTPVANRAFLNRGDGNFEDATEAVFGDLRLLTRAIKVADVNADGHADILLGTTYQTQSHLLLGNGDGSFSDVSDSNLPQTPLSLGDLEFGDVDADGDLDVVLADWGARSPMTNAGGLVGLWLNDGRGVFTDATSAKMPSTLVRFSWDLVLVDVDNDWDLDIAISCKQCPTQLLYENDGGGHFADVSEGRMPRSTNNYQFAAMDLDSDGFLDLVTVNDGRPRPRGLAERVLRNDGAGGFEDVTDAWWPAEHNPGYDDNVIVFVDIDSDGDADFLIGSLDGPDRLLLNDGSGRLTMVPDVLDARPSGGTLGMAIADLNGDGRPDIVEGQGEVPGHEDERVYFGTTQLASDTAPPVIATDLDAGSRGGVTVHARVHDNRTPNMPHDWREIVVRWRSIGSEADTPMEWYGENLFRAAVDLPADATDVRVCATDAAGNEMCSN